VQEVAKGHGCDEAADAEGDEAQPDLQVVVAVDFCKERGRAGRDVVEGGVDYAVEKQEEGDVLLGNDAEGVKWVGKVQFAGSGEAVSFCAFAITGDGACETPLSRGAAGREVG